MRVGFLDDMRWLEALSGTLRCRRFWVWQIVGAAVYAIPVVVRILTGNVLLPILSWLATPEIYHYVPGNLVEKVLVQAFFPGGAGGVAGEVLVANRDRKAIVGRRKYVARFVGAMVWVGAWSLFQLWGNLQSIFVVGSNQGNLFEYPSVYPLNFVIAAFAIFTPDVLGLLRKGAVKIFLWFKRKE